MVEVEREGQPLTLRPKQLVLATGMSGKPNLPDFPGMDVFKGDQHHSSAHPGPDAYAGKKAAWSSAATTRRSTSAARSGSTTPT